jgi:hypothetical protein
MEIGTTLLLVLAVLIFLYEAWTKKSLLALGLACFAASFVLTLAVQLK